jgi:hypothetical protein
MIFPDILAWQQFANLPHIKKLPIHEQVHRYNYYLVEQQQIAQQVMNAQQSVGGVAIVNGQEPSLPSNCIQFTANTTEGTGFTFEVEVNGAIAYTIDWGDGAVDENVEIDEGDEVEVNHEYPEINTEYTATLCFSDISQVIGLDFWGDD